MDGVRLLKRRYLTEADERAGVLRLVAERIDDLVEFQGQVRVRPDPERIHQVDGGLARGAEGERHVEFARPAVGDPVDLVLEALDVLCLLHELGLRDQERKQRLGVVAVHQVPEYPVCSLPDAEPVGVPDVEPLDRVADVHDLGSPENLVIPLGKILFPGKCACIFVHPSRTSKPVDLPL